MQNNICEFGIINIFVCLRLIETTQKYLSLGPLFGEVATVAPLPLGGIRVSPLHSRRKEVEGGKALSTGLRL